MVALLGQGVRTVAFIKMDQDIYQHSRSLSGARAQAAAPNQITFTGCTASHEQGGYVCTEAFDGEISYTNGWAYNGRLPAWIELTSGSPSSVSAMTIYSGGLWTHHVNDFDIEVQVGLSFQPVSGLAFSNSVAGGTIVGNRVTCSGQDEVNLTFNAVDSVTAIKINVYGSDTPGNAILSELFLYGKEATASATGDPHLQNIHGERFDLLETGSHVLINIPRGEGADNTLLCLQARARKLGAQLCQDIQLPAANPATVLVH